MAVANSCTYKPVELVFASWLVVFSDPKGHVSSFLEVNPTKRKWSIGIGRGKQTLPKKLHQISGYYVLCLSQFAGLVLFMVWEKHQVGGILC